MEAPSVGLALTLEKLGFPVNRLTTGTPPRIDGSTIDFTHLEKQHSDNPPEPLSFMNWNKGVALADKLICCYRTFTNQGTHDVVRRNASFLPKFIANEGNIYICTYCGVFM